MRVTERRGFRDRVASLATLNLKLVVSFLVLGLLPAVAVGLYSYGLSASQLEEAAAHRLEDAAITDGDIIDRNLFERYGDVQAFAANPLAQGSFADRQRIVDFLTVNYGIYDLMLIVDLDGRVQVANSVDGAGQQIDSQMLARVDVSGEEWFQVVASGETPPGGTYYTDVHRSDLVEQVYGEQRLTLPFTAPIYDQRGRMVAIWHNETSFERVVGDVMAQRRQAFADQEIVSIETKVLRRDGLVIYAEDSTTIFDLNLVDAGVEAAEGATGPTGLPGFTIEPNEHTGVEQINGYAVADGALGFEGYQWGVLVRQDASEAAAPAETLRRSLWLIAAGVAVVIVVSGVALARSLSAPLKRNARDLRKVADGDLRQRFDATTQDEVGQMGSAFNTALDAIGTTLSQVDGRVSDLAASSGHLDDVSQEMSSSSVQAASQVSQVAAGAEEIAANSASVAAAIEQVNLSIQEIAVTTNNAAGLAEQAVDKSTHTSAQMSELNDSATDIGDVVATITGIAEQTNLLALNATIEAARAGESGKGFAVVANEVKNLSAQTAAATDEIQTKVETIQSQTTGAVRAISEINELIDAISDAAITIAGAVEEQSVTTVGIGSNIQSVSQETGDISSRIAEMAYAVDSTNGGSNQTLEAASQLASIADELADLLGKFQLPSDHS